LEEADWRAAVDEFLRYFSTAALEMAGRTSTSEMVVGDERIAPGDGIVIHPWSVNHDPRAFFSPDEINIDRQGPRHLAFGMGRHQCLGQSLVRVQMSIGLRLLFERFPEMKPTLPLDRLSQSPNSAAFGLSELCVSPSAAPSAPGT
jgi:cytochrome P450